jgi:DNA mismatch repair protein MLH1
VAAVVKKKVASQHKVRTSAADRTLDSMFPVVNPAHRVTEEETANEQDDKVTNKARQVSDIKETVCFLASVQRLREATGKTRHQGE